MYTLQIQMQIRKIIIFFDNFNNFPANIVQFTLYFEMYLEDLRGISCIEIKNKISYPKHKQPVIDALVVTKAKSLCFDEFR